MSNFFFVLALNTCVVVLFGYALFCADPDSNGPGGMLHRFITEHGPNFFWRSLRRVAGERVYRKCDVVFDYVCYKPNPLMQIFYLVVVNGSFLVYIFVGHNRLPNAYFSSTHEWFAFVVMASCVASFVKASTKGPGVVTARTIEKYDNYPHDNVLFVEGKSCSTCKTPKIARSKHCRVCNHCVPRFDHHCGWINQCVGEENYKWFLLFLLVHCFMLWYGGALILSILATEVKRRRLWDAAFFNAKTGQRVAASRSVVLQYLMFQEGKLVGLLALAAVMASVLTGFLCYHLWLVALNTTTNEASKWRDAKQYQARLLRAHKRSASKASKSGSAGRSKTSSRRVQVQASSNSDGGSGQLAQPANGHKVNGAADSSNGSNATTRATAGTAAGAVATAPGGGANASTGGVASEESASNNGVGSVSAPGSKSGARQRRKANASSEAPPATEAAVAASGPVPAAAAGAPVLERSEPSHPGALPLNIYDNGVVSNLAEVLFPRVRRRSNRKVVWRDPFERSCEEYWVSDEPVEPPAAATAADGES